MTEAEEACPHDRMETAVEALNIPRENTDEGGAWVLEISEAEFCDESCAFAPIKRMGFSNGPGASFGNEPCAFGILASPGAWPHPTSRISSSGTPLTGRASSASTNPSPLRSSRPCVRPLSWHRAGAMGYGEHL